MVFGDVLSWAGIISMSCLLSTITLQYGSTGIKVHVTGTQLGFEEA